MPDGDVVLPFADGRGIRALGGEEIFIASQSFLQDLAHIGRLHNEVTQGSVVPEPDSLQTYR